MQRWICLHADRTWNVRLTAGRHPCKSTAEKRLKPHGYYKVDHTLGLWQHETLPVQFTLVVNDVGIKYQGENNAMHLINALK